VAIASESAAAGGSTDDTVDFEPAGTSETEETVTLTAPTWTSRLSARIDAAISGALGRGARPSPAESTRETATRKR